MARKTEYQALNRDNLVAFFEKGDKFTRTIGFELEHILLHAGTGQAVSYSEPGGVRDVLVKLAERYDRALLDGEDIIGCESEREVVTIEPAGQLEISLGPCTSVADAEQLYRGFREKLDPILDELNLETPFSGYNPAAKVDDLELIPKYRYQCMTKFLGAQAHMGLCMMRGTASLQVSIDFRNEGDAMRKLRIAEKLSPVLSLICDNSPIFEGAPREHELVRTAVWAGMNQDRVGTVPGSLDRAFSFSDYADYILTREAILVPDADAAEGWRYVADQTFDDIYADREMTKKEIEHALSMVWPDARLKNFVEIRPADAMPPEFAFGYVALVWALFYQDRNLCALEELLDEVDEDDVREAKEALMAEGYDAKVYGRPVTFWTDKLIEMARDVLDETEAAYLAPLADLVARRTTLAHLSEKP